MNCPYCKSQIPDNTPNCPICGQTVSTTASASEPAPQIGEAYDNAGKEPLSLGKLAYIAGWILIVVAVADFAGMFLGYDFTGYSWTPIVFGVAGEILIQLSAAGKRKRSDKN